MMYHRRSINYYYYANISDSKVHSKIINFIANFKNSIQ